jgi:hypothetical protein
MAADEPATFLGRARPVVRSDLDRALREELSEREDLAQAAQPPPERQPLRSLVLHGALLAVLALPAMLVVALGIGLASR